MMRTPPPFQKSTPSATQCLTLQTPFVRAGKMKGQRAVGAESGGRGLRRAESTGPARRGTSPADTDLQG